MNRTIISLALSCVMLLAACKKERLNMNCQQLRNGIKENNLAKATEAISFFIDGLPADAHTAANLEMLVATINGSCYFDAELICAKCIATYPEQSEIRISVTIDGVDYYKIIDISQQTMTDDKMKVVNMHE